MVGTAIFVGRRIAQLIFTLLVSSFVVFGALYVVPGDPTTFLTHGKVLPPQAIQQIRQQYHLQDPFLVRYWDWLTGILHGNFGKSLVFRSDVSSILAPKIGNTMALVLYSSLIIVTFGVIFGTVSALRGGWVDRSVMATTTIGLAIPSFVAASLLISLFAVRLGWFPVYGDGVGFGDRVYHLTLPAVALAIASVGYISRITRASVRTERNAEHVRTAVARGLPRRTVTSRHVVWNALLPITTASGLAIASLIPAVAIVETIFGLNGIGSDLIDAVNQKDYSVVQAIALIMIAAFVVINMIVDVLYGVLDPRMRSSSST